MELLPFLCIFPLLVTSIVGLPTFQNGKESTCGYASCPAINTDPNILNVHLVPHSHDDVGWLKTVDQYYYGSKNNIQKAGVQYILDSVIQALLKNPARRFIYVETAFFYKWWQEKPEEIRNQVRHLVENGQLEITGGAWSMNDEAAVHYHSTIDQFTWGFRKLNETLGKCARPRIGWQIDPFGHSREMASLFSQFGFDGFFFARLDWRDKSERLQSKSAEMIWQGSPNLGEPSQIFTSALYNHYSAPPGFCFDVLCNDAPIVDNEKSPEYNAEDRARTFVNFVQSQGTFYRTNNVIVTMGDDFNYQDALSYFINIDRLIEAINKLNTNVNVFYSSPACYVKAVHESHKELPTKTDDFFPYASDHHSYWNGYFTSRPTSKRFERQGNNILQVAKQLSALTGPENSEDNLDAMREAVGIMQHHDAITGTEKQHVADDYARIVSEAFVITDEVIQNNLRKLYQEEMDFKSCLQLNISQCRLTEDRENFYITVYNPLSRPVSHYVRVPVTKESYAVSYNGETLDSQIVPIFERIQKAPERESNAEHELVFLAEAIPPLGFKLYKVEHTKRNKQNKIDKSNNKGITLNFDRSGKLKSVTSNEKEISVNQDYLYYPGAVGNNAEFKNRSSGAYIFRPVAGTKDAIPVSKHVETTTYDGPLVTEYHQTFNSWVGQVVRVYKNVDFVEFNWIVGPIPVNDQTGKEVISRFSTDLKSDKVFYTDSNGRDMIKRIRGVRETFNLTHEEPIAENYCPVTTKITIKEESTKRQVSVLNDRAQGGSSLNDGEIELMIHRRLLHDDAFGVGEALNEIAYGDGLVATGKHYLITGQDTDESTVAAKEKDLAPKLLMEPWIVISPASITPTKTEFSGIKNALPKNIQILTLEPWDENTVLLRLEHIFEKEEDPELSLPVTVDIKDLFSTFKVLEVEEMALGANQLLSEVSRLQWKSEFENSEQNNIETDGTNIILNPMEIKTFILKIKPNNM